MACATWNGLLQARYDLWVRMAQNHRTPAQHVVDVFVVIDIIDTATASGANKWRV